MDSILNALHIHQGGMIAFVGAGGKTSLMLRLAEELSRVHDNILVTTTTKIMPPAKHSQTGLTVTGSRQELLDRADAVFKQSRLMVAASGQCKETGKLIGFDPDFLDEMMRTGRFRWILTEADGSARKPIKAPAVHEPVIPRETRYLIGLIGLSALDKPLCETIVHRMDCFSRITGLVEGQKINLSAIEALIQHPFGLFKDCPAHTQTIAFLNQADTIDTTELGKTLSKNLYRQSAKHPDLLVIGQAEKTPAILKIYPRAQSTPGYKKVPHGK